MAAEESRVPPDDVVALRDAGPADEPTRTLRVCSWNIKKLGHGTATDYAAVTRVLEDNCDFSAVLEVMQRQGAHPGYEQLVQQLGAAWAGAVTPTPRPNTSSSNSEFYAFVWRHALVGPCAGWTELRFAADNDGGAQGTGADNFAREPAYMCFEATAPSGERGADFVIAAYHATWSNGHTPTIAAEVAHLPAVFQEMAAAVPGEADLLVVGDFNLRPADLAAAGAFNDRTAGSGSTLNSSGAITANLYDHFVTIDPSSMSEMGGAADVLDVRSVAASPSEFYRTVSDHLPIAAAVDVTRDDD
ncbi:MAG: hypothetical protein IT379_39705 [Deltaproteobacteria bacterium]|nr:hypothetical protein [Deltaproteobacteria bacterium]